LGGTKLATAIFDKRGDILRRETIQLQRRQGQAVGVLVADLVRQNVKDAVAVGICVPGISRRSTGTVWAPNIQGWEDYALLDEIRSAADGLPVSIDSDRACYILGEHWKGNAQGCKDAIYLAVGTGIGAGIMSGGHIIRGAHDIAGAVGWMALERPFNKKFAASGCFESQASGEGIAQTARELLSSGPRHVSILRSKDTKDLTSYDIFAALERGDDIAVQTFAKCIELWGMAAANLVSIFDPEKLIFGGGVFGPASVYIPEILDEAAKWAQPIAMKKVKFEASALGTDAGLYGAGLLGLRGADLSQI
jgi:glucokinase